MTRHSPLQQFKQAKQIAQDHGLLVIEKSGKYQIYRRMATRVVFIAERGTPDSVHRMVCELANVH